MNDTKFAIECTPENAPKFLQWIYTRGGVAKWRSVNLGNPGASWSTPALDKEGKPYTKPSWQAESTPEVVIDPTQIGVYEEKLYKAFRVAVKHGDGLSFVLTDHSQNKLNKTMAECEEKHGSAHYKRGVLDMDFPSMGVYYTEEIKPLPAWLAEQEQLFTTSVFTTEKQLFTISERVFSLAQMVYANKETPEMLEWLFEAKVDETKTFGGGAAGEITATRIK